MGNYVIRRILLALPVLWGVATLVFFMTHLIPGDTVTMLLGLTGSEESAAALREFLGLDQPVWQQYLHWLGNLVRGDAGSSLRSGRPVVGEIWTQLPATLELTVAAVLLSLAVAVPIGVISAAYRNSWIDNLGRVAAMLGVATPGFWLGAILILIFALWLRVLPPGGYVALFTDPVKGLRYLILPAITLSSQLMAEVMRMTRSAVLEVIRQDYIQTARAKGLSEARILYTHALRNAMIPVATLIGIQAGYLLGGALIIEEVFARPGVGRLALMAISQRDYPMVQGTVFFITVVFVVVNLLVDVAYAYADPRIRYQ